MQLTVYGLGTVPTEHSMSQAQALDLAEQACGAESEQSRLLKVHYRRSGVKNRHTCVPYEVGYDWFQISESDGGATQRVATSGPGTQERMLLYAEKAPELAMRAAREALERAEMSPKSITHLVTVSCTGFTAPGVDIQLISKLGLPETTERVHVGFMGCHGAINGLRAARGLAAANPDARVLLC